MNKIRQTLIAATVLVPSLALGADASAYELGGGSGSSGAVTSLGKGLKELGFESLYLINYASEGDISTTRLSFVGGGTFRYYLRRNFSLGLNVSFLYKGTSVSIAEDDSATDPTMLSSSAGDVGVLGTVTAAYNGSLGGGMFIRPLLGVGGTYAKRTVSTEMSSGPQPDPITASVFGGVVRAGLHLAFYASHRFKLHAGPEVLMGFGKVKPDEEPPAGTEVKDGFLAVDGGFNVGISYVF